MKETQRNFLVGLFMIAGFGVVGFLMVMFGETPRWLGGAEYELKIQLEQISGIDDGSPVFLNGIKIGRVSKLTFLDVAEPNKGIEVITRIKKEFDVPLGAEALCIAPALGVGRGRVEITAAAGDMPPLEPGGVIMGKMGSAFGEIIPETMMSSLEGTVIKIGNFADELTPVAQDLHHILERNPVANVDDPAAAARGVTANLFTAIERFDRILKHVEVVIGDPEVQSGLREAIDNILTMTVDGRAALADFRDTSANLKIDASRIADKVEGAIDNFDGRVDEVAKATLPVLDEAARTTANMRTITDNLLEGKGTLGLLLTDNRLYEVLVLSVERIKDMVDSARRLLHRFEKRGRVGVEVGTPVGTFPKDIDLPK